MRALMKSEFRKLWTTRTFYGFLLALIVIAVVTVVDAPASEASVTWHQQQFVFFTSLLTRVFLFVLGIRIITDEYRHGTVVPTLLATPRRMRVLGTKLCTAALAGGLLATVAALAMVLTAVSVDSLDGIGIDGEAGRVVAGFIGAGALWTVMGAALGTIVRSQVLAIVGGLVWLMGIEDMLKSRLGDFADFLPGDAGLTMVIGSSWRHVGYAALILFSFGAVVSLASAVAFTRRDID